MTYGIRHMCEACVPCLEIQLALSTPHFPHRHNRSAFRSRTSRRFQWPGILVTCCSVSSTPSGRSMYCFHAVHRLPFAILPNCGRNGGLVTFQSRYLGRYARLAGRKSSVEVHGIQATLIDQTRRLTVDDFVQNVRQPTMY
jgi:hypothetical protein